MSASQEDAYEVHEIPEGHIQTGAGLAALFPLPGLRLPLGLEALFLGLLALAVPAGAAVDCPLSIGLFPLQAAMTRLSFLPCHSKPFS